MMTEIDVQHLAVRFIGEPVENRPGIIQCLLNPVREQTAYNSALFLHYLDDADETNRLVPVALNLLRQAAEKSSNS